MKTKLSFEQTRVLGIFLEKEVTTPDQYPLSLNAITTACNQKSNREPVVEFSESQVQNIVDELVQLRLLSDASSGGRVAKYRHRFYGSEFSAYQFNQQQAAILCVLFLRGPQTPGELRTRTNRLANFTDVAQVESCLNQLAADQNGPFVVKLAREPGKRESRFAHLFSGEVNLAEHKESLAYSASSADNSELAQQVADLTEEVSQLKAEIASIKQSLGIE
ncbi:DUF480 domain-containing protein [Catenovulum sp. 2E275]|uniref:YceH family protein n=1 Tax=Catenovulum sp. 2E275 TaxID=2980497 RepID=UPI0021D2B81C|nr:DUF480 domain-containing protein [Catenovulum sp. 2E275]MCU4677146.1 DUF480 domain-containing protein [Catenovulum sp. 2E275]